MATPAENATDLLGENGNDAVAHADFESVAVDDRLFRLPGYGPVRTSLAVIVVAVLGLGVLAGGIGSAVVHTDDCFVVTGGEHGGVLLVPGCVQPSESVTSASSGTPEQGPGSRSVAPSHPWVPMPRFAIDLADRALR